MFAGGSAEPATIIHRPGRDRFGDPVAGEITETPLPAVLFAPGGSSELVGDGANQVISGGTVYAPPGTTVRPTDQVRLRGQLYDIVGESAEWTGFGVVLTVRRITG